MICFRLILILPCHLRKAAMRRYEGLFKETTMATSCGTPPHNSANEQNNETTHAEYNLVGFSTVLCKTTTSNEHFLSFIKKTWLCDVKFSALEINNNVKTPTGKEIILDSGKRESGERNSFSKPCRPKRRRRVYRNTLLTNTTPPSTAFNSQ